MIIKAHEKIKIKDSKSNIFLFYGQNRALKEELIEIFIKKDQYKINLEETEILNNPELFYEEVFSNSFFEKSKLIIISRSTDKILNTIQDIFEKNLSTVKIILNASLLEKKSKLRKLFENENNLICVPFYEDNQSTLVTIAMNFFSKMNIKISNQNINLLIEKSKNDRKNLENELKKIEAFLMFRKSINTNDLKKLLNLTTFYDANEITDQFLAKNKIQLFKILNENVLPNEDNFFLIRMILYKSKRLKKIIEKLRYKKNIDQVISSYKPPIFWKDKSIIKQQIQKHSLDQINTLIIKINHLECLLKKNIISPEKLLNNFILEQV